MARKLEIQGTPLPDEEPQPSAVPLEQGIGRAPEGDVQLVASGVWDCSIRSFRQTVGQIVKIEIKAAPGERMPGISVFIDGFRQNIPYFDSPRSGWHGEFFLNSYSPGQQHKCMVAAEVVNSQGRIKDALTWEERWTD
ncbi:MAG: hypothetical protein L0312_12760 [Acidobacteria bacterium]|nr:hypothetical protein [Acidobacteriota bacterium]